MRGVCQEAGCYLVLEISFYYSNNILNSDDKNKHDHYRNLKTIEKTKEKKPKTPHNPTM